MHQASKGIGFPSKRLKFLVSFPKQSELRNLDSDTLVSFVPMAAVSERGDIDASQTKPLSEVSQGYTYFRDGDVVIAKITPCFENGKGALARGLTNGVGFGTTELTVIRPEATVEPRFLYYFTVSDYFRRRGEAEMYGAGGQKRVPEAFVRDIAFPVIPKRVQSSIADFLDRETAKADALVAKYERLIDILEEKRVALISQVVTKGLDPNAPMKDSGIEWVGHIPEHWQAHRASSYIVDKTDGPFGSGLKNEHYADSGVRVIRLQNITAGKFRDEDAAYVAEGYFVSLKGHDARPGDLLVAGLGDENNFLGRACILPSIIPIAMVKADCFRYRFREDLLRAEFVAAFLNSSPGRFASSMQSRGATRQRMNLSALGAMVIPLPPLNEQEAILHFLERADRTFEKQKSAVQKAILLTTEHRSALIAAAVTGQIDVPPYKVKDLEGVVA